MLHWFHNNRKEIFQSLLVALLVPVLFVLVCGTIYFGNVLDYSDSELFLAVCFIVSPVFLFIALLAVQLPMVGRKPFAGGNLACFLVGFFMWLQANVFNWGFRRFDGSYVEWEKYNSFIILEISLYLLVILLVCRFRKLLYKKIVFLSILLMVMQGTAFLSPCITSFRRGASSFTYREPFYEKYDVEQKDKFHFSKEHNIILLVLDSYSSFTAARMFEDHPEFKTAFSDFTFYPNCMAFPGATAVNIPAMLTGRRHDTIYAGSWGSDFTPYDEHVSFMKDAFTGPSSVPFRLKQAGYRVELYPSDKAIVYWDSSLEDNITALPPRTFFSARGGAAGNVSCFETVLNGAVFRCCPTWLKMHSHTISKMAFWNLLHTLFPPEKRERYIAPDDALVAAIESDASWGECEAKSFKYIHFRGVHSPHVRPAVVVGDFVYDRANRFATGEFAFSYAYLKLCERIFERLKQFEKYDNSLIFVVGDHHQNESLLTSILPHFGPFTPDCYYNQPLFLVKRPKQTGKEMAVDRHHITCSDVAGTILETANIELPNGIYSVFNIPPELDKKRAEEMKRLARICVNELVKVLPRKKFVMQQVLSSPRKRQVGSGFFTFPYDDFVHLALFGDEENEREPSTKTLTLRPKSKNDSRVWTIPFKPKVAYRRGQHENLYLMQTLEYGRDVWVYHVAPDFHGVPDGVYEMSLVESYRDRANDRETRYNCEVTVKGNRAVFLTVPLAECESKNSP